MKNPETKSGTYKPDGLTVSDHCGKYWRVTGKLHGRLRTILVVAADRNEAVRKGSHHPHMLVVRDAVLLPSVGDRTASTTRSAGA